MFELNTHSVLVLVLIKAEMTTHNQRLKTSLNLP